MSPMPFENDKKVYGTGTVSYTHLDVYKRQLLCRYACNAYIKIKD